jgi:multiple sugar transport system permease protein
VKGEVLPMRRRMTWKEFLFVLPLLLIVAVFSLYPIVTSGMYTVFDYQTNNQAKNDLYLGGSLNAPLYVENLEYLQYYLDKDLTTLTPEDQAMAEALIGSMETAKAPYANLRDAVSISAADARAIGENVDAWQAELSALVGRYPEADLRIAAKVEPLLTEMRACLIGSNFIGTAGYARLFSDGRFLDAARNTFVFTAISVALELVLGMALALIMNRAIRGIGMIRTTALIPWAIPTAVSALIWCYLYDGTSGVVAMIFAKLGLIASPELLLTTFEGTMLSAILADVWKTTPYMALLLLAGLQVIDTGLYESAAMDGAGPVRTFTRITLPMLKSSMLVALLFRTLDAFRVYDLIAVLTKGTPETLSIYAYKMMIGQSNYGYGSVIVVAMFALVALIAFVYIKVLGAELISE